MTYAKFAPYDVVGAILWVVGLTGIGYLFGNTEWVKANFSLVALALIIVPGLPAVYEVLRHLLKRRRETTRA